MPSPITEFGNLEAGFAFKVALLKELFGDFLSPLFALQPRTARVTDVGAFQRHLQDEMTLRGRSHLDPAIVQIRLETSQKLVLAENVCR